MSDDRPTIALELDIDDAELLRDGLGKLFATSKLTPAECRQLAPVEAILSRELEEVA